MRITPLDVRKQEFRRSVRGFDCDEVRAFMATLADEYEIVLVDNKQIREKLMVQDEKITEYKAMERTLRDTLMTAEKLMQETRENANREGDLIVQESKLKAKEILAECRLRTEELRKEIEGLRKEKEAYLGRFKSLAESQIQFIESHRSDFRDLDQRLTTIVDSVAEGVAGSAEEAEKEAVVETIVEALIQPEMAGEMKSDTTPAAPPAATNENDIWRDYTPVSGVQTGDVAVEKSEETHDGPSESAQEPTAETPENQETENREAPQDQDVADDGGSNPDNHPDNHHDNPMWNGQPENQEHEEILHS